ncbi:hypothetical protein HanPI659440_Chr00c07g0718851 [Helianthus annuus]|nr:hypothetical protein HanPI659440_Chr00c07g0718851 [Helianthus annuus]
MAFTKTIEYLDLMRRLNQTQTPDDVVRNLTRFKISIYESDLEEKYGEPLEVIGYYIIFASLCCIIATGFDLVHGFRSKKLWFPVKYFPLNAVTLAGITVAMKLPVDLSGSMPGAVDQVAKIGSIAFMCTIMANFLPSLATMNSNELLTNIIALSVLVITLVVNICIQISTGVVGNIPNNKFDIELLKDVYDSPYQPNEFVWIGIAILNVTLLLLLLIILVSSSFAILNSKQIIELKYQEVHEKALIDDLHSTGKLLTVEKLHQQVSKYWIMAGSGSPQFISACSVTTTASGVICVLTFLLHLLTMLWTIALCVEPETNPTKSYDSAYNGSTLGIFIVQSIGIILGTVAPFARCFASISFKLSIKSMFKVEKYWFQTLLDWKYGSISLPLLRISFPFGKHKSKVVIRTLKNVVLHFCIILQVVVVVVCKIIVLVPFPFTICLRCLKWLFRAVFSSGGKTNENTEQRKYVLQVGNENQLAESTLKRLLKSLSELIKKSEKKEPKHLLNLIKENPNKNFQGVRMFDKDDHHVQCSPSKVEYQDCWSLTVVTLTTIAITLPNIEKAKRDSLLKSVRQGLEYVTLVEETLDLNVSIQNAAKILWEEVDFRHKWLGSKLKKIASQVNKGGAQVDANLQIVQLFLKKATSKIEKGRGSPNICANSMSGVTESIIRDKESHKKLFDELSSRITDIMAACLTNLPQAIAKKCHTSVIEKREESVKVAAKLLGETKKIINILQEDYDIPNMEPKDLPFIDKWCAYLSGP